MKRIMFAAVMAAVLGAFADGDDNIAVLVSTTGPDCYLSGDVVMDGECYALVWSRNGVFEGFTAGGAPIDTLVAAMETGQRSFRILRRKPDGKSYARDIAEKYGITYDDITKNYNKRKEEK